MGLEEMRGETMGQAGMRYQDIVKEGTTQQDEEQDDTDEMTVDEKGQDNV